MNTTSLRGDLVPEHITRHVAAVEAWDKAMTRPIKTITLSLDEIEIIIAAIEDLIFQSEENFFPATERVLAKLKDAIL